jgi:hypothetical protein
MCVSGVTVGKGHAAFPEVFACLAYTVEPVPVVLSAYVSHLFDISVAARMVDHMALSQCEAINMSASSITINHRTNTIGR